MTYIAQLQNQSYTLDLTRQDHQAEVRLDETGQMYTLDWHRIATLASGAEGGRYSLLIGGRSYEIFARLLPQPQGGKVEQTVYELWIEGERFEVVVEDERAHRLAGMVHSTGGGAATISAPMPGLVAAVLVAPGDSVGKDQPVAILEAMKMENDLLAPLAGTVREVRVSKGQTVDQGEVLVVIENA